MSQTTTTMRPHLPLKRPAGLATHPSVLLNHYVYGYLNRVLSSRRLEREAGRNVEVGLAQTFDDEVIGEIPPSCGLACQTNRTPLAE